MDDNWGNILYLILMALFVIIGALKKKKKPVENFESAAVERAEDDAPVGIENLFDTILGADSFTPQQEHPYQAIEDVLIEEQKEELPDYKAEVKSESHVESLGFSSISMLEVEDLNGDEEMVGETGEIDWRQAIISKEILDRKYI